MKQNLQTIICATVIVTVGVSGECNQCQANNPVACHSEDVYSLCIDGAPTFNNITCPDGYVCTGDVFVCYPKSEATPSCTRNAVDLRDASNCGVCGSSGKVFACLNETTIAFCFGDDVPHYESLSYCTEGTVCDLNSGNKFCSDATLVEPSCRQAEWSTTSVTTTVEESQETTTPVTTTATTTAPTTTTVLSTTTPITATTTTEPTTIPSTKATMTTTESTRFTTLTPTTTESTTTTTTTPMTPTTTTTTATTTTQLPTTNTALPTATTTSFTTITTPVPTTTTTPVPTTTATLLTTTTTTTTPTPVPTTTTSTTTILTTTTEDNLTALEICEQYGLNTQILSFPQPNDLTCTNYFTCTKVGSSWVIGDRSCSSNRWFDPTLAKCSETYNCPTAKTETTAPPSTPTTVSISTSTEPTATTSSTSSTANPNTQQSTSTTERTLTIIEVCEQNGIEGQTSFFPLHGDTTCKNYIMCTKPGSTWTAQQYTCSTNKWFDPESGKCSDSYSCPSTSSGTSTVTTVQATTTTTALPATTTTRVTTSTSTSPTSTKSTTTTTASSPTTPNTATTTTKRPTTITTRTPTTTTTTTTTSSPTTQTPTAATSTTTERILTALEVCELKGIESQTSFFALPGDTTCKNYVMCTRPGSSWTAQKFTCSSNKWFDPSIEKCSETYSCPSANSGTITGDATSIATTTPTRTTTPQTTTTTTRATTPTTLTTSTTTTTTRTTSTQESSSTTERILTSLEVCEQNGVENQTTFFALPGDTTCKKYIMCTKPGSSWTAREMTCTSNKWFDPILGKCDPDFKCST